jgi:glycosyltransferase involved in cell wall biosynthesis
MRVALVHDHLISEGGGERVLRALAELWPAAPIYTLLLDRQRGPQWLNGHAIKTSFMQGLPLSKVKYQWYLPLRTFAIESFDFTGFDVVISDSSAHAKGIMTPPHTLHVNYCHTPTRYLWIDKQRLDPLEKIWPVSWLSDRYKHYLKKWDLTAARRVDKFVANSVNVQQRIRDIYGQTASVIYPPVEVDKFAISHRLGDYFLVGGRLVAYKRFDMVIEAFNKVKVPLKVFGTGPDLARLRAIARGNIEFLGQLPDTLLPELYARALAFIYPQEEDFGLTAVEAMASGRPVIAYRAGGALETVREGITGIFFDYQDWEALARKLIMFRSEKFDPVEIRNHASTFSKTNFKRQMQELIQAEYNTFSHEKKTAAKNR